MVFDVELMNNTKVAAYFLWDYTKGNNALGLWYCAEDIACFMEQYNIIDAENIIEIIKKGSSDQGYIQFVRHIAFRLFLYTDCEDEIRNWYIAEMLIFNREWIDAITKMALTFRDMGALSPRSEYVRGIYTNNQNKSF